MHSSDTFPSAITLNVISQGMGTRGYAAHTTMNHSVTKNVVGAHQQLAQMSAGYTSIGILLQATVCMNNVALFQRKKHTQYTILGLVFTTLVLGYCYKFIQTINVASLAQPQWF